MNRKLDQADRAPGKLWRKVHNLAMAISFWGEKKKKKMDTTCPELLWSHRKGDNETIQAAQLCYCCDQRAYLSWLFPDTPQQPCKRHIPHPNTADSYI